MIWIYHIVIMYVICFMIGCSNTMDDGNVRLVGGTSTAVGVLQVHYQGSWGSVCDDGSLRNIAQVACHNLQREFVAVTGSYTPRSGDVHYYIYNIGVFLLDDIECNGAETNLAQCSHSDWGVENCGESEHIWVQCSGHTHRTVPATIASTSTTTPPTTSTTTSTKATRSTTTSSPVCVSGNKTVYLSNGATTADIELEPGCVITLPAVDSVYKTRQGCELYLSVIAEKPVNLCPGKISVVASPVTGVADINLTLHDLTEIKFPVGVYPVTVYRDGQKCSSVVKVSDHRILRRLVFKAVYDIQCSLISDEVSRLALRSSAQQHFQVISGICRQDCNVDVGASAKVACSNGNLTIEWPTQKTFTADVLTVQADLLQKLISRQKDSLPILPVVVLSKLPPIVYPTRTAENGYVEASLRASCIANSVYDEVSDTCLS